MAKLLLHRNLDNLILRIDALRVLVLSNDEKTKDRFTYSGEAIKVALAANNARLDNMNEFRETLSDQANKMMTRVEALAVMNTIQDKALGEIAPLRERIEQIGKPNYGVYAGFTSVLAALIAGAWLILGLKIENANSPLALQNQQLLTSLTVLNDKVKSTDEFIHQAIDARKQTTDDLNTRLIRSEDKINELKGK